MTRLPPPGYWLALCVKHLKTTERLARELWEAYERLYPFTSQTTRFELDRLSAPAPNEALFAERLSLLANVVTPKDVFAASLHLSPEGRVRRKDVVQLEARLCDCLNGAGEWK